MRVLQINKFFHAVGGADTFFFKTCDLLTEHGHEVAHFSTKHPKNRPSPFTDYFVDGFANEDLPSMGFGRKAKAFFDGIYSFDARRNLSRIVKDFHPDIVHAHSFNYQLSPSIFDVFRESQIPIVVTLHDYFIVCGAGTLFVEGAVCERCRGGRHHNSLRHTCYWNLPASVMAMLNHYIHDARGSWNTASRLLAPSQFLLNKLVDFGIPADRIVHVPIFIDFPEEQPARESTEPYVLYFGRLASNKGIEILLEAAKNADCKLLLIGDGPLGVWVDEQCATRKSLTRLAFVSSREELRRYIAGAAFSVTPSVWYENQPATILETYAMGRPVIGSRLGGIPELIDDGQTGLLFEAGKSADLAEKMRFLLGRPELCLEWGRNGQRKLRNGFSRESHYDRLMEIYRSAATDKRLN